MRAISDLMASLNSITDQTVRHIRKTAETPPRVSVLDVIGIVTGHSPTVCSHTLQNLLQNYPEVGPKLSIFKFSGRGQRETHVADAYAITELIMVLPGRAAGSVRKAAASVLVRYLGGDTSIIDEIAQNHMDQQELDEDHPARIFGQTVESDRVKRAREELTLGELQVQLAEQAGALKRRRIESIQYCLEALDSGNGVDDRDRVRAKDMTREVAFGSGSSTDQPDPEICIRQIVNAAGRARESPGIDIKTGALAKKLYLADFPTYVFPKKTIWAGGQECQANSWKNSQRSYVERALASL